MNRNSINLPTKHGRTIALAVAAVCLSLSEAAAVATFTEDFTTNAASWKISSGGADPAYFPTGGPDNSAYISNSFNFASTDTGSNVVLFRGQDNFNSSSDAFVGNWIADGVTEFTLAIRHDFGSDLSFFVRFATPNNSPAVSGVVPTLVPTGVWTQLTIQIDPSNVILTSEGPPATTYNSTFSNVGNIQVAIGTPASLGNQNTTVKFDIDKPHVTAVPEPTTAGMIALGAGWMCFRRRTRRTQGTAEFRKLSLKNSKAREAARTAVS